MGNKNEKSRQQLSLDNKELIMRAKCGDKIALQKLYFNNINLIVTVAQKYKNNINSRFDFEDLMQEAYIGFVKAINNFNFSLNKEFSTLAVICMENNIKNFLRQNASDLKITSMFVDNMINIRKCYQKLLIKNNRIPTIEEISLETKIDIREISKIQNTLEFAISLDTYNEFEYKRDCVGLYEFVSNKLVGPEEILERNNSVENVFVLLRKILAPNCKIYSYKEMNLIFEFGRLYYINKKNPNPLLENKINKIVVELMKINDLSVDSDANSLYFRYKKDYNQLRNLFIIIKRYGFFDEECFTAKEIGTYLGMTQQGVSRIEIKSLNIIRENFIKFKTKFDELDIKKLKSKKKF